MLAEPQIVFCVTSAPDQATHEGRTVRIRLRVPAGAIAGLSEVQITGALRTE